MDRKLGNRIRALRELKGITLGGAARALGMTVEEYDMIESGLMRLTLERLEAVAAVLGVKVSDITEVLDWPSDGRVKLRDGKSRWAYEMVDFFYANKHMAQRLGYPGIMQK